MPSKHRKHAAVHVEQSVSEIFAAILRSNLDYLGEWEDPARSWDDIEGVHQMRVTLRRMRSALTVFHRMLPEQELRHWSAEMRWAANELGPARDLDVFIAESLDATAGKLPVPGEEKLGALAARQREQAYRQVVAMLDSERYEQFKSGLAGWLKGQHWVKGELTPKQRQRQDQNVLPFARKILDKRLRLVLGEGTNVDADSPEALHRLRIACKKLRYAAEFFAPLFPGMDEFVGHMKGLQDLLGIMHDVAVTGSLLDSLLSGVPDPEPYRYAGALVGWRARQYEEIRGTLDERWDEFVSASHPWWKKSRKS